MQALEEQSGLKHESDVEVLLNVLDDFARQHRMTSRRRALHLQDHAVAGSWTTQNRRSVLTLFLPARISAPHWSFPDISLIRGRRACRDPGPMKCPGLQK
jgi:hypothetical protein